MVDVLGHDLSAGREKIVSGIGSPLGFYVLALLIVETFLVGAGWLFNLPMEVRTNLAWAGIGLFVFVVIIVTGLVVKYPENLVFTERSHLHLALYGAKDKPASVATIEALTLTAAPEQETKQLPPSLPQQSESSAEENNE
jgi:hypothetical protein